MFSSLCFKGVCSAPVPASVHRCSLASLPLLCWKLLAWDTVLEQQEVKHHPSELLLSFLVQPSCLSSYHVYHSEG